MYNVKVCSGLGSRVCCTSCTLYVHKMTMSCLIYLIFVCDHLFGSCLECLEKNCEGKHYQTFLPAGALLRQGPAMAGAPCPGSSALSPSSWGKLENCNPGSHHPASLTWVIYSWCKHVKNRSVAELLFLTLRNGEIGGHTKIDDPSTGSTLQVHIFPCMASQLCWLAWWTLDPSFEPFQTVLFLAQWHDFCQHTTCSFPGVGAGNGWQPKGG